MDRTLWLVLVSLVLFPFWIVFDEVVVRLAKFATKDIGQNGGEDETARAKMTSAPTTAIAHALQMVMWWTYIMHQPGMLAWVVDFSAWNTVLLPHFDDPAAIDEQETIMWPYAIYLAFGWHSLVKDTRRSWGKKKGLAELSFLIHHLLTIGLTIGAFNRFVWRASILTRVIHDPADVFLYGSKFYAGLYDLRYGSFQVLSFLYLLNCFVWIGTRVLLYGAFDIMITVLFFNNYSQFDLFTMIVILLLLLGSILMWVLQVLWMTKLLEATKKFIKEKGQKREKDIIDVGQADKCAPLLR